MIISSVNYKGGVGKSTLTQNLAVALAHRDYKVCIVDADVTAATMDWAEMRHENEIEPPITCIQLTNPKSFSSQVKKQYADGQYDVLIIDCPPTLSPVAVKAMYISHYLFIPLNTTGGSDIKVTEKLLARFQEIKEAKEEGGGKIEAYLLANGFRNGITLHSEGIKDIKELSEHYEVGMFDTVMHNRVAYGEANSIGYGVIELSDKKAQAEIEALIEEILAIALTQA